MLFICIGLNNSIKGQWSHDFSLNDLSEWSGNVQDFIINDDEELQLNAPAAGDAFIYRSSSIDFDTVSFKLYHLMDFAPSDNNQSRIYLALDNEDPSVASGYFIEIGENGSDDALKFYYQNNGTPIFIASAAMGAMATEPATVRIEIDVFPSGLWSVRTDYDGLEFPTVELEFMDAQFSLKESLFFGLSCKFSASRADKFFYDDLSVLPFEMDTTPPDVVSADPQNQNELLVTFTEPVADSEAQNISNYTLNSQNPIGSDKANALGTQYLLTFSENFDASLIYLLTVSGISDLNGNVMTDQMVGFLFSEKPTIGDLLISEVLFDPYPNGEDFIEIFNRSNKSLDLKGMKIINSQNEEIKTIDFPLKLSPGSYLALTEDVDFLIQEYKPDPDANIEFQELPALNNDGGNVSLVNESNIVLESFDYSEDQHFQLIDDTEGVSLERISFEIEANTFNNWQSAAENVRFATPGYKNSNTITSISSDQEFSLASEIFSPNQDGDNDQMILNYQLEKPGFLASVTVYDAAGFKIKQLSNNELLGSQGIIVWDGTDMDGQISDLGIYVIIGNAFHPDGEVKHFKLTTVLADFID
ncbi:MAG: lamin tail domain-containing protein [Saprospiraceae bacterium]|nr:lamin tail domain-containing protein [Saprospiraceae bacterium]